MVTRRGYPLSIYNKLRSFLLIEKKNKMENNLKIPQKSIKDFVSGSSLKKWKCEQCKMVFTYPKNQKDNLICCFCKRDLEECFPNDPLITVEEKDPNNKEKTFVVVKRDKDNNIIDIFEVDEEKFNLINNKENTISEKPSITTTDINISGLSPFKNIGCNLENKFYIVVYRQNDFCAITNILKGIIDKALNTIKIDEEIDETVFEVHYHVKDDDSYIDKNIKNYPQIAVFYGNSKFIEYIPIKDLNENSLYHKLFYYYTLKRNGLL